MQTKLTITANTFSAEMLETNHYTCFIENSVQVPPLISTATKNDIQVQFYQSLHQAQEYYHFGMPMHSRTFTGNGYKFGFNGQEKEDDIYGEGNAYDLGLRIYDARLARMFSIDPRTPEYPWQSPYVYHRNNPVNWIDFMGGGGPPIIGEHESGTEIQTNQESSFADENDIYTPENDVYTPSVINYEINVEGTDFVQSQPLIPTIVSSYSLNVPSTKQSPNSNDCSFACAESMSKYYGGTTTQAQYKNQYFNDFGVTSSGGVEQYGAFVYSACEKTHKVF